jgi:hypothetical protein
MLAGGSGDGQRRVHTTPTISADRGEGDAAGRTKSTRFTTWHRHLPPRAIACQGGRPPFRERYGRTEPQADANSPLTGQGPVAVILAVIPPGTTRRTGEDQADWSADLTGENDTRCYPMDGAEATHNRSVAGSRPASPIESRRSQACNIGAGRHKGSRSRTGLRADRRSDDRHHPYWQRAHATPQHT